MLLEGCGFCVVLVEVWLAIVRVSDRFVIIFSSQEHGAEIKNSLAKPIYDKNPVTGWLCMRARNGMRHHSLN